MTRTVSEPTPTMSITVPIPEEFKDWQVLTPGIEPDMSTERVLIEFSTYVKGTWHRGRYVSSKVWLVPPKPPVPDVNPGAVVGYVDKQGKEKRAVRRGAHKWCLFDTAGLVNGSVDDAAILHDSDGHGFTVELGGLSQ